MVPLNLTCLHCLQHSFIEHLFNLYVDGKATLTCIRPKNEGALCVFTFERYIVHYCIGEM